MTVSSFIALLFCFHRFFGVLLSWLFHRAPGMIACPRDYCSLVEAVRMKGSKTRNDETTTTTTRRSVMLGRSCVFHLATPAQSQGLDRSVASTSLLIFNRRFKGLQFYFIQLIVLSRELSSNSRYDYILYFVRDAYTGKKYGKGTLTIS